MLEVVAEKGEERSQKPAAVRPSKRDEKMSQFRGRRSGTIGRQGRKKD